MGMKDDVLCNIITVASQYNVEKVVLFGSRARGDHSETSDYDIAIFGNALSLMDQASLCSDMEEIHTLKKIDVVFVNKSPEDRLREKIENEGVVIYEQTGSKKDKLSKCAGSTEGSGGGV